MAILCEISTETQNNLTSFACRVPAKRFKEPLQFYTNIVWVCGTIHYLSSSLSQMNKIYSKTSCMRRLSVRDANTFRLRTHSSWANYSIGFIFFGSSFGKETEDPSWTVPNVPLNENVCKLFIYQILSSKRWFIQFFMVSCSIQPSWTVQISSHKTIANAQIKIL